MATKRDLPPHNYAKAVDSFPLKQEIRKALSNRHDKEQELEQAKKQMVNEGDIEEQKQQRIYFISHKGAYYRGSWRNGLPDGKGECIFADGTYYEDDKNGFLVLPNGATYKGQIYKSIIQGQGEMNHRLNEHQVYSYKGQWVKGKPDGWGEQKFGDEKNYTKYAGYFKEGQKNCYDSTRTIEQKMRQFKEKGKLQISSIYRSTDTQEHYQGEFLKGLMHGFGDYYRSCPDGQVKYTGQFYRGKKKGFGELQTQLGVLIGTFENDVINGHGQFRWKEDDGRVYIGNFLNSKFHGQGKIILKNGSVLEGVWEDGHSKELTDIKQLKQAHM